MIGGQRVEVEREPSGTGAALARQLWVFWIDFPYVVLHEYREDTRPTKRHKWVMQRIYNRMETRTVLSQRRLNESEVPFPDDVKRQALGAAAGQLLVCKWVEHPNGRPRKCQHKERSAASPDICPGCGVSLLGANLR